jgi:hypothetical protein
MLSHLLWPFRDATIGARSAPIVCGVLRVGGRVTATKFLVGKFLVPIVAICSGITTTDKRVALHLRNTDARATARRKIEIREAQIIGRSHYKFTAGFTPFERNSVDPTPAPRVADAFAESRHSLTFKIGTPLEELERQAIEITLRHTRGDKNMAARMLGIAPRTIYRHLERQQPEQEGASTEVAERAAFTPPTSANPDKIE